MSCQRPKIEFFHDVVCGWCLVMSPGLRQIARELSVEIEHRSFVLQISRAEMVQVFGLMERAKATILGHWENCALHDDENRINVRGMRRQSFEYPSGLPGAIACKAAEIRRGQDGHWDMFDAIQSAHLTENFNIADREVSSDLVNRLETEHRNGKLGRTPIRGQSSAPIDRRSPRSPYYAGNSRVCASFPAKGPAARGIVTGTAETRYGVLWSGGASRLEPAPKGVPYVALIYSIVRHSGQPNLACRSVNRNAARPRRSRSHGDFRTIADAS